MAQLLCYKNNLVIFLYKCVESCQYLDLIFLNNMDSFVFFLQFQLTTWSNVFLTISESDLIDPPCPYTYDNFYEHLIFTKMIFLIRDYWAFENYVHIFGNLRFFVNIPYFQTHLSMFLMCLLAILLIAVLQLLSYCLSIETYSVEKKSSYECGFEPFGEAHIPINIHFYLIGILYLIFDLELLFFYPWFFASTVATTGYGYIAFFSFLLLVGAGFVYEWKQGGLEWHV